MDEQPPSSRPQLPIWGWALGLIGIFILIQFLVGGFPGSNPVAGDINDVVTQINENNIKTITINDSTAEIELKNKVRIGDEEPDPVDTFTWLGDPKLSAYEQLEYHGITNEQFQELNPEFPSSALRDVFFQLLFSLGPILLILWILSRTFRQMQGGGGGNGGIFGFGKSRAKNINDGDRPTVTFDDVAGVEEAKEEVSEIVQFLREPERFIKVGARIPKGVLMVGPPGTGKTLLARAIAGEAGVPFYHISGSEFVEMFVGVGASRVRDLFSKAKENAPAIVFVDEIDAVGRSRGVGLGGGNDEREQTLNQILTEMDGFDKDTNIIVIAATNRADVLDAALLRPGRFDRKVMVDLPDIKGREQILGVHSRGKPIGDDIDLTDWSRMTAGFSGADLENLLNEAAIFAARHNSNTITHTHLQAAFDRIVIGPERKSRVMDEQARNVVAHHEAGHAVVQYNLPNEDPIQKITIVPRGRAGGFVMSLPEDRYLRTEAYYNDRICTALAGRAAEEIFFGEVTDGASSDLQQATGLARGMITQLGFSDALGLPIYGQENQGYMTQNYSDEAAAKIDEEVKRLLQFNYDRAKDVITENRGRMEALIERLLEVETIDRPEFEAFMNS